MKRKEGLHHVRDEGGGGVLGSVPGSEGADFLGRAINSFLQPPVKECGSEQAREGCKQAGGRVEGSLFLAISLTSIFFRRPFFLAVKLLIGCSVPTTRCQICKRVSVKLQVNRTFISTNTTKPQRTWICALIANFR